MFILTAKQKNRFIPYLYVFPILILSGAFLYYCIGFTAYTSFHEWNGIDKTMKFIGFQNYKDLFTDRVLYIALFNNLVFFIFTISIQAALGLLIAVLLMAKLPGHTLFKSTFFMPIIMAPIIISAIFRIIMDFNLGSLNMMLRTLHLDFIAVSWLGDPRYALMSVIIVNIFEWMGFSMVMYYSGLLALPDDVYESARIDGSSFFNTLFKITIPMLRGTTSTLIVLGIVGSLKTFDIIVMLTGGGPGRSTEFLTTFLYKRSMEEFNGGSGAAIGMVILIIALIMSIIQIRIYETSQKEM